MKLTYIVLLIWSMICKLVLINRSPLLFRRTPWFRLQADFSTIVAVRGLPSALNHFLIVMVETLAHRETSRVTCRIQNTTPVVVTKAPHPAAIDVTSHRLGMRVPVDLDRTINRLSGLEGKLAINFYWFIYRERSPSPMTPNGPPRRSYPEMGANSRRDQRYRTPPRRPSFSRSPMRTFMRSNDERTPAGFNEYSAFRAHGREQPSERLRWSGGRGESCLLAALVCCDVWVVYLYLYCTVGLVFWCYASASSAFSEAASILGEADWYGEKRWRW